MSDDNHLLIGRANGVTFKRHNPTEAYVVIPPAYIITDTDGATWTFGTEYNTYGEINVLRNDAYTGEFATRIEYRKRRVHLYGRGGKRTISRNRKYFV